MIETLTKYYLYKMKCMDNDNLTFKCDTQLRAFTADINIEIIVIWNKKITIKNKCPSKLPFTMILHQIS